MVIILLVLQYLGLGQVLAFAPATTGAPSITGSAQAIALIGTAGAAHAADLVFLTPPRAPTQDGGVRRGGAPWSRAGHGQAGFGLVEILVVVVILAVVGAFLYQYFVSTTRTVETIQQQKPMSAARLAADRATVAAIRTSLTLYFAQHGGYPPSKDVVATLLNPPPAFQCEGNDYRYEPATGLVTLVIDDVNRC
jgi:prepilin-type N-terminal cleavage/methylation domain-containing protein